MTVFAITWDGVYRNLMVATASDVEAAQMAVGAIRSGSGLVVGIEADLLATSGPALVGLYNALGALAAANANENLYPVVTRFATRGDAARRIYALLDEKFKHAPEVAAPSIGDIAATTNETTTEEGTEDMATKKGKKAKLKAAKTPRTKKPAKEKAGVDDFGLRKGSKNSQAAAMFARASGSTMAKVKETVGDTFYGLVKRLGEEGHKVKKDGQTIFLTAK